MANDRRASAVSTSVDSTQVDEPDRELEERLCWLSKCVSLAKLQWEEVAGPGRLLSGRRRIHTTCSLENYAPPLDTSAR